eukprot:PhM_4_TR430/c0_g1_i1/m.20126
MSLVHSEWGEEEKLMDGVYITRRKPAAPKIIGEDPSKHEVPMLFEMAVHLDKVIAAIEASNVALQEELLETPGDADYLQAIEENVEYLKQHRKDLADAKRELAVLAPHLAEDAAFQALGTHTTVEKRNVDGNEDGAEQPPSDGPVGLYL